MKHNVIVLCSAECQKRTNQHVLYVSHSILTRYGKKMDIKGRNRSDQGSVYFSAICLCLSTV